MSFKARLTEPSVNDLNWIHTSCGGKNSCILISGNSVLPNCVGYAWGRFMEILGSTPKLSRNNAESWYPNISDGYDRGNYPKLGSVICWSAGVVGNGDDGAGHVAIVEKIYNDGSILISQSGYNSSRFWTSTVQKGYSKPGYHFQGFIYNPAVSDITPVVIRGEWGNGDERYNRLTAAGYDYNAIQSIVNSILSGNSPKKTNEELAKEVIRGEWGNGNERYKRLTAAGYDYNAVQSIVNNMLK